MNRMFRFLISVLFIVGLVSPVFAADKVGMFGAPNTSGTGPMEVDSDRVITVAADAGIKLPYQRSTTGDTLVAADSGKIISVDCTSATDCIFYLPAAEVGMTYTFISEVQEVFKIDPDGTDTIRYGGPALSAGDKLNSPGATADSVTLVCTQANYWNVGAMKGTWTDGN